MTPRVVDMSLIEHLEPDPSPLLTLLGILMQRFNFDWERFDQECTDWAEHGIVPWWGEELHPNNEWIEQHT